MEYNVYFSPTGATGAAAKALCPKGQEIILARREFTKDYTFTKDDLVFFSVPSYQGRCPGFALDRIKEHFKGNDTPAVINASYGGREFEDTIIEVHDAITALGFKTIAAVSSLTEHSMVREFLTGRPDKDDKAVLASFREKILNKLSSGDLSTPEIPGNRPYRETHPNMLPSFNKRRCISCSACAVSCPAGAIDSESFETDGTKCISCMRCIKVCPSGAKYLDPAKIAVLTEKLRPSCSIRKENALYL